MVIENNIKRPAVFLDRDGTIIEDRGHLSRPSQVIFFTETVSALRRLNELFDLFIVTNQSGVAKGLLTMDDVGCVNGHVVSYLAECGIRITDIYVCPHDSSDNCECIKPKPYFLKKAEKEHGIDLSRSFAIGDHPHDVAFAENAGAHGIYVLTGHGMKHRHELSKEALIAAGIEAAADIICRSAAAGR
ncbi:histidinol-phosphate phosphatase family protein [Desulfosalsimonas propionicica]|uniref:D,D-heptose 1,7-bisphosphate phosphatase n=1 Tax=Desulfosalsimonas propionicica TaxID=332175 RepID=A0A7W0C930_9BACT|nr:HAD family hydrolase [Desulfosalsimonas propionicica]MBA2881350.1 histidinol-phosphate phosphatase family protein [Desulfosalsimonas propionicica]